MKKLKSSNTSSFSPSFGGGRVEASSSLNVGSFSPPSEGSGVTFYERVYDLVRLIPPRKVTSYGVIASFLGSGQSSRMVGWAMNNAHVQEKYVPAHRVVNRNGLLTGKHHFGTSTAMQELLEAEGIQVVDDQILYFEKHFWNPLTELAME